MKTKILSAGIVPVRWSGDRWLYLMLRAYQYWDFPKGRTEAGETLIDTALRETREETALVDLNFRWGYIYVETGPYARGKVARYYIAETGQDKIVLGVSPELGRPEHHEYRWMDYEHACNASSPRVLRVLAWSHPLLEAAARGPLDVAT
jgi:8-oxo-dGTP pyrophosphatase MutT (NUDIX family)